MILMKKLIVEEFCLTGFKENIFWNSGWYSKRMVIKQYGFINIPNRLYEREESQG
jgi:hypothetical protein